MLRIFYFFITVPEYGRLNIWYTVMSKRKILQLVAKGIVPNWDDPRLFTLTALRRRGFPAESIADFCEKLGVTQSQTIIDPAMLDACVRNTLNIGAPRTMAVMKPLNIRIINYDQYESMIGSMIDVLDYPGDETRGSHRISAPMTSSGGVIYIERSDYCDDQSQMRGYRRLTNEQSVGLRYLGLVISVQHVHRSDATGDVISIDVTCCKATECPKKPKAFIHWVAADAARLCEVRNYSRLFTEKFPEENPAGYMACIDANSLVVNKGVMLDKYIDRPSVYTRYQFERTGYYVVDEDSTDDNLVFNRIVDLKEDPMK